MLAAEVPNRREDLSGAPRPPLPASFQATESRLVEAGIHLMSAFGVATVTLPGGVGRAAIAPGDRRGRNPKLEPVSVVRIKGYWPHEENPRSGALFPTDAELTKLRFFIHYQQNASELFEGGI